MKFEIVGSIANVETIASGLGVRVRSRLCKVYGQGRWRKLKGPALIRLPNGALGRVEVHDMKLTEPAKETLKSTLPE